MSSANSSGSTQSVEPFEGVWWLLSRVDRARDGSERVDPVLGPDALGILTYANGRFAAQFMKRDRSAATISRAAGIAQNNTGAINGYDAYFGTYEVDEETGEVLHRLVGALTPEGVGLEVSRRLVVDGNNLVITLDTTTLEGEPVTRTLSWQRLA